MTQETNLNLNQSLLAARQSGNGKIEKVKIVEVGTSGTEISGGRFYEEYLNSLTGPEAADVWDEMRRSDDQIKMLLRVVSNPILSARWFFSPASDDEKDKKIADFVKYVLMSNLGTERHRKSFKKFQREALSAVPFGFSLFEITQKIVFNDPQFGTYIGLKGLDWRSPKTIEEWDLAKDGELLAVRQSDNSERAQDVWMNGYFLLHVAPEMEGDNYEGISMLRPIYGNWYRKNVLRKLQMIGIERAATGVPIGTIPQGQINSAAQSQLEDSLSRFVSHERQYMITPEGFKIDSLKIEHDAEKVQTAIEAENIGMTKSFLANFMELGLNGSGSYALGTDLSDIFLAGIQVYADAVTEPVNLKLIPMIVDANFGKQGKYPELKIEGINDKAGKEFAEVLKLLKEGDFVQISDKLKESIHKRYNLPDFDRDLAVKTPLQNPDGGQASQLSEIEYNLAELNISKNIEKVGKQFTQLMQVNMKTRAEKLVDQMLKIWSNAPKNQRMKQVNALAVPGQNEYKKLLSQELAAVYVQATQGVQKELKIEGMQLAEPTQAEIKDLPSESKASGKSQADLLTESQDADLRKNLFFSFTSKADTLPTEEQMRENLLSVVNKYLTSPAITTAGPNAVANAVNLARNAVFQKKAVLDKIESFIFVNPSPEAKICIELAGRVFTKAEYIVTNKLPPLHHHCNSWIKAQITGKSGNKPLSPAGLSIQGTPNQIEAIERSITF